MIWVNGQKWGKVEFPNKEHQFLKMHNECYSSVMVTVRYDGDEDLYKLIILLEYLKSISLIVNTRIGIDIPYLPYARADRDTTQNELPTLKFLARVLNNYNVSYIGTYDAHSGAAKLLIDRLNDISLADDHSRYHKPYLRDVALENAVDYIFLPDAGAKKRYSECLKDYKVFCGSKCRGEGGKLSNLTLIDPPDLKDKVICIVDDICCKGGTAYGFAKLLREAGAKNVILLVTHCEPAIFDGQILKDYTISKVYTTNSILRQKHERIHEFDVLKIKEEYEDGWDL